MRSKTNTFASKLMTKIQRYEAKVAIVGLGYVGLPLAVSFAEAGFTVFGLETDKKRLDSLKRGKSYILDVSDQRIASLILDSGDLVASDDFALLQQTDAVIICVPTPLNKTRDPDLAYIISASKCIVEHLHKGQLVILESTSYPGTTEDVLLPMLTRSGLTVGSDFFLAYSPERIDPGRTDWTLKNTPKIVGGVTSTCREVACSLYKRLVDNVVPVSNVRTAEMVKLLENTYRAVNIAMVNEMAIICERLGLNVWEVVEAASTKPFGFMPFLPGPGLGGHCIPKDPEYLAWKLKSLNYRTRFIELATEINSNMPTYVVDRLNSLLNEARKPVKGSKLFLIGMAYKRNVGDVRDSPAIDIATLLSHRGAQISYHDPYVPILKEAGLEMRSVELTEEVLRASDCTIILTDHSGLNWQWIADSSRLVLDTRNATRGIDRTGSRVVVL